MLDKRIAKYLEDWKSKKRRMGTMTIAKAIKEWKSKKRRMGCMNATEWFCKRVPGFYPKSYHRYTKRGELYGHTIATDGVITIDLAPYADRPNRFDPKKDGRIVVPY